MKKYLKPVIALGLVAALAIGGTLAYLTDTTDEIKNEFTVKEVDIELTETTDGYELIPGEEFEKDPTITIIEDESYVFVTVVETIPTVALAQIPNSDPADYYEFSDYVSYEINTTCGEVYLGGYSVETSPTTWEWLQVGDAVIDNTTTSGTTTITYVYALVDNTDALLTVSSLDQMAGTESDTYVDAKYEILEGNKASVPKDLTQEMINLLPEETVSVDLSFQGYAVQTSSLTDVNGTTLTDLEDIYTIAIGGTVDLTV